MSFRDANGNFIGGCGVQILGLLLLPVGAFLIEYVPWKWVFIIGLGLLILLILFNLDYKLIWKDLRGIKTEEELEEERKKKELEKTMKWVSKRAEEIDKKEKSQSD